MEHESQILCDRYFVARIAIYVGMIRDIAKSYDCVISCFI